MKTLLSIVLVSAVLLISSCKKDEEGFDIINFKVAKLTQEYDNFRQGGISEAEYAAIKGEANVSVKFYRSEIDAQTDKNVAFEKTSSSDGTVEYQKKFSDPGAYFIKVAPIGEFNYLRGSGSNFSHSIPNDNGAAFLTLTPSRLQIQVVNVAGAPIANASVTVYLTEEDYNKVIPSPTAMVKFPEYGGSGNTSSLSKSTDATGIAKFEGLAPRIFWFRVTPGAPYKSNDNGYFKLANPLPDDPEVYFVTTVILKQ